MSKELKVRDLRKSLASINARWDVDQKLKDEDTVPVHELGGSPEGLPLSSQVEKIDFKKVLKEPAGNPFIRERRETVLKIKAPEALRQRVGEIRPEETLTPEGAAAVSVDWRLRFTWPWITTVQNQNGCGACWAFATAALVESMVRIEHCVWSKRSEGDVHDGIGKKCADEGNLGEALDFVEKNGLADPDCYPWRTNNPPYQPCPDRSGRTVKIPDPVWIGDIAQQKAWLDTTGPLATWFDVYSDFDAYGSGVYHKSPVATQRGGHFMLVVGYDDNQKCWIVKNSWGTSWGVADWRGQRGYALIGYGESGIDTYAKVGVHLTNPDPWTKRRLHSGNMIESGNGALHRNFEMLATTNGTKIQHWWRDASDGSWHKAAVFGTDAAICPILTATTYNRNFESVHLTPGKRLHHWWLNQANGQWTDGVIFGPTDTAGVPGFIQGNYGAPGNFEVVVRTADGRLSHWWRNQSNGQWLESVRFGSGIALSGPSLVQNRNNRDLELVCVLNNGVMQHWWRDDAHGGGWKPGLSFGSGVHSPPCMIEGQFGATDENHVGNYELCVAVNGQVQHWWRDNSSTSLAWTESATFAHDVESVLALVEGSYGFNLEVIVLRRDGMLQHYWRGGGKWNEGVVIGSAR